MTVLYLLSFSPLLDVCASVCDLQGPCFPLALMPLLQPTTVKDNSYRRNTQQLACGSSSGALFNRHGQGRSGVIMLGVPLYVKLVCWLTDLGYLV